MLACDDASVTTQTLPIDTPGAVVAPGDPGYDNARRIWNGEIDRRPAFIVRCSNTADVQAAIRFARERNLELSVRAGGHGVGGQAICEGGLVVDLSPMKHVEVDPSLGIACAGAGVLWGELDGRTQARGLATVGGVVTHTGIAGLTLGGGIGWLMRKHGATVDNLVAAEVVTAQGDVLVASEHENPDLFWGLRGGGGNFGVVTSFRYRLHPVGPTVLAGPVLYPLEAAGAVLRRYRDVVADAPDELTTILNLRLAPPLAAIPADVHGRPVLMVGCCWAGDPTQGEIALRPLRQLGPVLADLLGPRPYLQLQSLYDAAVPHGWHYYWKSVEVPPFTDAAIDALVDHAAALTSPRSYCIIFQMGGALSRVDPGATAFTQRSPGHNININAVWTDEDRGRERHVAWTRAFHDAMRPHASSRVYLNFLDEDEPERVRAAFDEPTYERLLALKREHDPDNVFSHTLNIRP